MPLLGVVSSGLIKETTCIRLRSVARVFLMLLEYFECDFKSTLVNRAHDLSMGAAESMCGINGYKTHGSTKDWPAHMRCIERQQSA